MAACRRQTMFETQMVNNVLAEERAGGMENLAFYEGFQARTEVVKDGPVRFLLDAKRDGKKVAGYGAGS